VFIRLLNELLVASFLYCFRNDKDRDPLTTRGSPALFIIPSGDVNELEAWR
jgi:hypothetical protein